MSEIKHAWEGGNPHVEALAKEIARRHVGHNPDTMMLPYQPTALATASGLAFFAETSDLRPLWTFYWHVAELALRARDDAAIAEVTGDAPVFYDPETPDQKWRRETGLDGEAE